MTVPNNNPNNNPVNNADQNDTDDSLVDINVRLDSLADTVDNLNRSIEAMIRTMPPEKQANLQHDQDTVELHDRIALLQNNVDDVQQNQELIAGTLQELKDALDAYHTALVTGASPQPANPGTPQKPPANNPGTKPNNKTGQPNSNPTNGQPNSQPSDKTPQSPDVKVDADGDGDQAYVTTMRRQGRRRILVKKPAKVANKKWYDKQPHEFFTGKRTMQPPTRPQPPANSQGNKGA
jgi:hypothetical protein